MKAETMLIKKARIINPCNNTDAVGDIYIENGKIAFIGKNCPQTAETVIEAEGLCAAPGLIDMHVHLRDPGQTHKEDILTGCKAAAAGGFTGVACMPNTLPSTDSAETVEYILEKAKSASARVYPVAAITKGLKGTELTDFEALAKAGAKAFSDDGRPVENAALMLEAIKKCGEMNLPVVSHCEDLNIINGGIINKGKISEALGVKGMDRASEDISTARETALAESCNMPIHICHVSTKGSVAIIRSAKQRGARVTCETAPHYFMFTDEKLLTQNAFFRMNPPLREEEDRLAVIEGIRDGTIDVIATDHAPHTTEEKADFYKAPNGVIGLETSLSACITGLVNGGVITLSRLIEMMSASPAKILGVEGGSLEAGKCADIVLFNPTEEYTVSADEMKSKAKNTPFDGVKLTGRVKYTILNGKIVYKQ